jgi:diaminohydroxyphosphoribosylaminopyrimidine deaminase / 5-amino-6-(5-phosphoribosylamino)uracil reductase
VSDAFWLDAAVALAEPHLGTTADNPTVGAIILDGICARLGQAVTAPGGRPHAETQALTEAGPAALGATLVVTLEPCNHTGRTPPCTNAIIDAGISRVVVGVLDADPRTAGEGVERLRSAGITVDVLDHRGSARLHEGFLTRQSLGRPFVTAKLAVSTDGMIGRRDTANMPITGEIAREWTHRLRGRSDAVMVGARTARIDNPRLTVRLAGFTGHHPRPVILAGAGDLDPGLDLLSADRHAIVLRDHPSLAASLKFLGDQGINALLVEGGAAVTGSLLKAGLVDRFHLLTSAAMIGPDGVPASPHGSLAERLAAAGLVEVDQRALGADNLRTFERA